MSVEKFIANRISDSKFVKGNISKPIVKIGIIGITIGVAVMLLTVSIILGFKKEIVDKITGLTTQIVISNINVNASNEPEPIKIGEDTLLKLQKLPYIKSIQRTAFKNGILKTEKDNEGIILKGIGNDYNFKFLKSHLVEGRLPIFDTKEASKDIFISKTLSDRMDLKLNQKMLIYFISQHVIYDSISHQNIIKYEHRSRKLKICGIFKTNFADFDEKLTLVDIKQIQRLNYWENDQVGSYEVTLQNFENIENDLSTMRDFFGYNFTILSVKELYSNIFIWLDKLDINGIIVVVMMILVATINMITALLILILERANMVGLLKVIGMTNVNVRKIFLFISIKLICKGLFFGNIVGIGLCLFQYYFKLVKLDSATYYVDYVAIQINLLYFLYLNLLTFCVCFIMLIIPSYIVTKLTPIKTLKFD